MAYSNRLKITKEHFNMLADKIRPFDTPDRRKNYIRADLSDRRYRWDLLRLAGLIPAICNILYKYINDEQIDSALKQIVPTLK